VDEDYIFLVNIYFKITNHIKYELEHRPLIINITHLRTSHSGQFMHFLCSRYREGKSLQGEL
jgi:hypothetical protein